MAQVLQGNSAQGTIDAGEWKSSSTKVRASPTALFEYEYLTTKQCHVRNAVMHVNQ